MLLYKMTQNMAIYKSSGIGMAAGPKDKSKTRYNTDCTVCSTYYPCHRFAVNTF